MRIDDLPEHVRRKILLIAVAIIMIIIGIVWAVFFTATLQTTPKKDGLFDEQFENTKQKILNGLQSTKNNIEQMQKKADELTQPETATQQNTEKESATQNQSNIEKIKETLEQNITDN